MKMSDVAVSADVTLLEQRLGIDTGPRLGAPWHIATCGHQHHSNITCSLLSAAEGQRTSLESREQRDCNYPNYVSPALARRAANW